VCERSPFASIRRDTGIVIKRYELGDEYRYVVRFEDGREEVFFDRELFSVPPSE
jgi:hypothetical protein